MKPPKAPDVTSERNGTPMVVAILVLLIIFMVITPMLTKGAGVVMVKAKNPIAMKDADKEDAILGAITRNGEVFLSPGNKRITVEDMAGKVRDLQTNKLDKTVYVKADMRAKYEKVEDVVDNLRAAGVDQLGLLTEVAGAEKKKAAPPAGQ